MPFGFHGTAMLCRMAALLLLLSLATAPASAQKGRPRQTDPDQPQTAQKDEQRDDPAGRARWFMRGRKVRGENPALLLYRAFRQKTKMREAERQRRQQTSPAGGTATTTAAKTGNATVSSLDDPAWVNLGPTIITGMGRFGDASGRTVAVAVDQNDATGNTAYVGGAYGGVWKTTNGAASPSLVQWTPLYDTDSAAATLAVGAIALQPGNSNLILVGTGEPHNAGDSYYGLGILRSTDAGASWELIGAADNGIRSFKGLGISKFAFSTTNTNLVVAAAAQTPLGLATDLSGIAASSSGLYWSEDAGATWNSAPSVMDGSSATQMHRVTDVAYNAALNKFFAVIRHHGFYESSDGKNWIRMANQPGSLTTTTCPAITSTACPIYRGQLAVRPGSAEMYALWVRTGTFALGALARTLNGSTWTSLTTTGITSCGDPYGCGTAQGFYNLYIGAIPNGTRTDVYVGAVNIFKCSVASTGTTGLCNATTGTNRWLNLTHVYGHFSGGSCPASWPTIHPDQHTMDFLVSNPNITYFGNDGGIYRTLTSRTGLVNGSCSGTPNAFQDLNNTSLGSLTQFISFSMHPTDDDVILGGTQDNGSPAMSTADGQTSGTQWFETWGGDGGFNEIDQTNPNNWYVTNTEVSIQKCTSGRNCVTVDGFTDVVTSAQVGGDAGAFYTPYILDPANQARIIVGTCRVWRGPNTSSGWSSANALSPNFEPGGALPCNGAETNLVRSLAAGGTPVSGVSPVIYAGTDGGAGSGGGRIWVTTNANAASPAWSDRTGGINPGGFPISYVALDPADASGQTAYITIMGFTGSPVGAGHVFKTTNAGVSWTDIGIGLPDSPADAIVVDPRDPDIVYVATDVGVFVTFNGGGSWSQYGSGLPNVTPVALRIFHTPAKQKLRVATHGRGVWETDLASGNGYSLAIANPSVTVHSGVTGTFNGTLTAQGDYSSAVALACDAGGGGPSTCTPSPVSQTPTEAGAAFTVSASDETPGDYSFDIKGAGTDPDSITQKQPVTLKVIAFALADGADLIIPRGSTGQTTLALTLANWPADRAINATCSVAGAPAGMGCSLSPASRTTAGGFTLTVTTTAATPTGAVNITVTATDALDGTQTRAQIIAVDVQLNPDFVLTPSPSSNLGLAKPGQSRTRDVGVAFQDGYTGTVALSCSVVPAGPTCGLVADSLSAPGTATLTVQTGSGASGHYTITVTGNDGAGKIHAIAYALSTADYELILPASASVTVGTTAQFNGQFRSLGGPFNIDYSCDASDLGAGATCSILPASPLSLRDTSWAAVSTISVTLPLGLGSATVPLHILSHDVDYPSLVHNVDVSITRVPPDFSVAVAPSLRTIAPGGGTTYTVTVTGIAGFTGAVGLGCNAPPANVTCSFSPAAVNASSGGSTSALTVLTTSSVSTGSKTISVTGTAPGVTKTAPNATLTISTTTPTFTLANSTATRTVSRGASTTFSLSVRSTTTTSPGSVTMSCVAPLPAGVACSFNPASFTPTTTARAVTATVTTTGATPVASHLLQFQAASTSQFRRVNGTLQVTDYTLAATPASQIITSTAGGSTTYDVVLTAVNGFSSAVSLNCTGLPLGASCSFAPASLAPTATGAHSTLMLTTTASAPPGASNFTVQGTGGSLTRSQALEFIVDARDFTIAATPAAIAVVQGSSNSTSIATTALGGLAGEVALSCSAISPATALLSCSFDQSTIAAGGAAPLTLAATSALPGGTYAVTVQGRMTDPVARTRTTVVTVNVPDFGLSVTPASQTVTPGNGGDYAVATSALNGFAGNIDLGCAVLTAPLGTSCALDATSVAAGGSTTMRLTSSASTPSASYTVRVTASSGATVHTQDVSFAVNNNDFTLTTSTPSQTVRRGFSTGYALTLTATGTFASSVTLSCVGLPANVTCTVPTPSVPSTTGSERTVLVRAGSNSVPETYNFDIAGAGGGKTHAVTVSLTIE